MFRVAVWLVLVVTLLSRSVTATECLTAILAFGPDGEALIRAIEASPTDETPRLVFADYLDDLGDPRARVIRADVALARIGLSKDEERRLLQERYDALGAWYRRYAPGIDPFYLEPVLRPGTGVPVDFRFRDPVYAARYLFRGGSAPLAVTRAEQALAGRTVLQACDSRVRELLAGNITSLELGALFRTGDIHYFQSSYFTERDKVQATVHLVLRSLRAQGLDARRATDVSELTDIAEEGFPREVAVRTLLYLALEPGRAGSIALRHLRNDYRERGEEIDRSLRAMTDVDIDDRRALRARLRR